MVVVTGVAMTGEREVLGCAVGDTEGEAFWSEFLRSLRTRGLSGVRLVISDHHLGLKAAIAKVFVGAAWQRCRVHFMRNALGKVTRANAEWWPPRSAPSSPSPTPGPSPPSSSASPRC